MMFDVAHDGYHGRDERFYLDGRVDLGVDLCALSTLIIIRSWSVSHHSSMSWTHWHGGNYGVNLLGRTNCTRSHITKLC